MEGEREKEREGYQLGPLERDLGLYQERVYVVLQDALKGLL